VTALEQMLRGAFRAKADEVPSDVLRPLRLPPGRRRSFSLAYGGGGRKGAPARRHVLAAAVSAVLVAGVITGSVALSQVMTGQQPSALSNPLAAAAIRNQAATWIVRQVSRSARVSCDPVMCQALKARGFPAGDLLVLGPGTADPLGSAVIVATAAVRGKFGDRLAAVYAPAVLASFGSGSARVDIRVIASHGAAAYWSALSAGIAHRKQLGALLAHSSLIQVSATARRQLLAGHVDSRLETTIADVAAQHPVHIMAFADSGPGASAGQPLRSADLARPGRAAASRAAAFIRSLLAFLRSQRAPYRPAQIEILRLAGGQQALRVEFPAPSPPGPLAPNGNAGT
jgi:hypothetical protein